MSWFPLFVDLEGRSVLIAGGGAVALRKAEKLLPYGPRITVVAPEIAAELAALPGLRLLPRPFRPEDLEGAALVIAAAGDPSVNRRISALCRERGIPVNAVDDPEACTFLFPALVKRGELSAGISTGGASPTAAAYFKERFDALLPEGLEEILDFLRDVRPTVKGALPEEGARSRAFAALFRRCLELGRGLTARETEDCLRSLPAPESHSGKEAFT